MARDDGRDAGTDHRSDDDPDDEFDEEFDDDVSDDVHALGVTEQIDPLPPVSEPVSTARRKHGAAGAMLAAGMFGVDIALGRKPKEEAPVVVDANSDPQDLEKDGIVIPIDASTRVVSPPLPRQEPRRRVTKGKGRGKA